MEERIPPFPSPGFCVKTTDLVQSIQNDNANKDFYLTLLLRRLDSVFGQEMTPLSMQKCRCRLPIKIPRSPILEECDKCKDKFSVKLILIVAIILESFETLSLCREDCWELLKRMYELAKSFQRLKDSPILADIYEERNVEANPVLSIIIDASFSCFFQNKKESCNKLVLNRHIYRKDIKKYLSRVEEAQRDQGTQMLLYILRCEQRRLFEQKLLRIDSEDVIEEKLEGKRIDENEEFEQAEREEKIREEKVKHVIRHYIKLRNKDKLLAVVLQGANRQNLTDLADAVCDSLQPELISGGWKLYRPMLTSDVEFNFKTQDLHSEIVNLLAAEKKKGRKMSESLRNKRVFIRIDNIVGALELRKIFEMEAIGPMNVWVLVTSPNMNLQRTLTDFGFKCEVCKVNSASESQDPLLLEMVQTYLNTCEDKEEAPTEIKSEWVNQKNLVELGFRFAVEISFANLPDSAQDAFIDICSFFSSGWDWDEVSFILGKAELQTLQANAWVKRNSENQITVTEFLRIFGQRTNGASLRVRVTSNHEFESILQKDEITKQIKGIWLSNDNERPFQIPAEKLELMSHTLRVLSLGNSALVVGKCNKTFQNLRFLQIGRFLKQGRSANSLPFDLKNLQNLRYLSCDEDVDFDLSEVVPKLEVLKLCGDEGFRYASTRWNLRDLRKIKLKNFQKLSTSQVQIFRPLDKLRELCLNTCSLVSLPEGLSQLYVLQKLDLHDCKYLRNLPKSFGNLRSLEKLNLGYCSSLRQLPESLGQLQSLEELILSHCSAIKQLPQSFVCLSSLKRATFSHCKNLQKLPSMFELLTSLEELDFSYCHNLEFLAPNFERLSSLQLLYLHECSRLKGLPTRFSKSLLKAKAVVITLSGCSNLSELREEFCEDNDIEDLSLSYCLKLKNLPSQINQLSRLRKLNLSHCESLRGLPNGFSELAGLEVLNLSFCYKLKDLCKGFHHLKALRDLNVSECPRLAAKWMKKFRKVGSLRLVDIRGSFGMTEQRTCLEELFCPRHFIVIADLDDEHLILRQQKILHKAASIFFKDEVNVNLIGLDGMPFFPSTSISADTVLALFFDYSVSGWDWKMLENEIDDLFTILDGMNVIYIGRSFTAVPTKLVDKFLAYTPENSQAIADFAKLFFMTAMDEYWHNSSCIVRTNVVQDDKNYKHFREWESITGKLVGRRLKIEEDSMIPKMIEKITKEKQELLVIQGNNTEKLKLSDVKDKMIFLLISKMEITPTQISFFSEIHEEVRSTDWVWVWVPVTNADENLWLQTYKNLLVEMRWLLAINPSLMDQKALTKFTRERMGFCEMPILVRLDFRGQISTTDVTSMVATLGSKAWLFLSHDPLNHDLLSVDQDFLNKLEAEIQNQSHLRFLLQGFTGIDKQWDWGEPQITWLYGGAPEKVSDFNKQLKSVHTQAGKDMRHIIYVGRRRYLEDIYGKEEEKELHHKNNRDVAWSSLSFEDVKRFWHHIPYVLYLIAYLVSKITDKPEENNEKLKRLKCLRELLLGLWSLDCISKRNSSMWMMAIDNTRNEILTGRGKELVEMLYNDQKSRAVVTHRLVKVYSTEIEQNEAPLIEVMDPAGRSTFSEDKCTAALRDGIWLTAHPSSHLIQQISDNNFCSLCLETPVYHCDICDCFGVCQKCYISEFVTRRKGEGGDQIYVESA